MRLEFRSVILAALTVAAPLFATTAAAQGLKPVTVRLDWVTHGMHAAPLLAMEKGMYRDAGLDVKMEDGNGSVVTVQLVGSGQFDIGHANLASMAMGRDKGLSVKSVAGYLRRSDMGVLTPVELNIKTVKDLIGKKVIYTTGSLEAPFLDAFFKAGGTTRDKVNLVSVAAPAKISTYLSGGGDAVISTVPNFLSLVKRQRPSNAIHFVDYGLPLPGFGLLVTEKTMREKADEVRRFVKVTNDAWTYIIGGKIDEAVAAMVKQRPQAKIDPAQMAEQVRDYLEYFYSKNAGKDKPIGWQSEADWAETVKAMQEADVLNKTSKATDFFTNEFIDAPRS
ncbi:MAG: ABC transporter substrate-binding protein [Alphaproteobacteria bacterium]|nr:ABC transporter substrate-binding protein [Alphaproteobacteria bacterium]